MRAIVIEHTPAEIAEPFSEPSELAQDFTFERMSGPHFEGKGAASDVVPGRRCVRVGGELSANGRHDGLKMIEHGAFPAVRLVEGNDETVRGIAVGAVHRSSKNVLRFRETSKGGVQVI